MSAAPRSDGNVRATDHTTSVGCLSRIRHGLLRLGAALLVVALLCLVPVLLFGMSVVRIPSADEWRQMLSTRRVDEEAVLATGAAVFLGLWLWFTGSAVGECWTVLRWRRNAGTTPLPAVAPGPTGWLRSLVRLAVLAGAMLGTASGNVDQPTAYGAAPNAVVETHHTTPSPGGGATVVSASSNSRSRSLPLQQPLGTALRDHDHDGRIERPLTEPVVGHAFSMGYPTSRELVSAVMFAAGALALLDSARRRRLRSAPLGSRPGLPSLAQVRTELTLRTLAADEQMVRLDVALRAVSGSLAACGAMMTAAIVGRLGDVRVLPSVATTPSLPWRMSDGGWWSLPASVTLEELAQHSRTDAPPCPALLHIGTADDGELFIDLEAVGVLEIISHRTAQLIASMTATLEMSPFLDTSRILAVGEGSTGETGLDVARVASLDEAVDLAAALLGDTLTAVGDATTFDRRVATRGGESFEPVVLVVSGLGPKDTADLRQLIRPGKGIGALVVAAPEGSASTDGRRALAGLGQLTTGPLLDRRWILRQDADSAGIHVLEPCGIRVRPSLVAPTALADVHEMLAAESAPFEVAAPVVPIDIARPVVRGVSVPFVETEWALLVRTLGAVEVVAADGTQVQFDRSKALELVVWLALHRRRPTRGAARAALWDLDVRDATFANVVSEARRALARASLPLPGDEWIPRTLTDALPLHDRVVSDAELLEARIRYAEGLPHREAIDVITPGLEVVTGMPFAGSNYLWCDAEGHASAHVLLVVGAATRLAQHHLALGDVEGVFWATGKGLLVLSGHEELVAMRMRAHASAGDLAGVRDEWERYERALQADPWAASRPSPKLSALRRELLGRVS
ncbi:MAG: hypothetical protein RLY45_27 [Actinomycetota bacterium]